MPLLYNNKNESMLISSKKFTLVNRRLPVGAFNGFVSFGNHEANLRELLFPMIGFDVGLELILSGSLESVGVDTCIFPVSERVVIERTIRPIFLGLYDLTPNLFKLSL